MEYLAHGKQTIAEHLKGVSEKSSIFAAKIGLEKHGELIGMLHDLGKYSKDFQNYLKSALGLINPEKDDYADAI